MNIKKNRSDDRSLVRDAKGLLCVDETNLPVKPTKLPRACRRRDHAVIVISKKTFEGMKNWKETMDGYWFDANRIVLSFMWVEDLMASQTCVIKA